MSLRRWLPTVRSASTSRPSRKLSIQNLEGRDVPAAPAVPIIPDVTLTSNLDTETVPIAATDADPGDTLTYTARAAGTDAYLLTTDLGLKASSRAVNYGGQKERWFQDRTKAFYFLLPNGEFHAWGGTAKSATGPLLATLAPVFHQFPDMLTKPRVEDLPFQLDQKFALSPTADPARNFLGRDERWLVGRGGVKYFVTPDGQLSKYLGGKTKASVVLADLDPAYHADLNLLAAAKARTLPVSVAGNLVTVGTVTGVATDFAVEITVSDGANKTKGYFTVHATNPTAPEVADLPDQILGVGENSILLDLEADDIDIDKLTYTVRSAATEAYALAADLGLKAGRRAVNWGGEGEKWFTGRDGWYFLKPSGDFHQWDGTLKQATGDLLATLPPAYFHLTDLLLRPQNEDLAYVLDKRLALQAASSPAQNSLGLGEKWLSGSGGAKFYITPDGSLYKQGAEGAFYAQLGPSYHKEINRLYAAQPDRFDAKVVDGELKITTKPNYFGSFVVDVAVSDGVNTTRRQITLDQSDYTNPSDAPPSVVGALSTSNTTVLITFTESMNNSAVDPANYGIVQDNSSAQTAGLTVTAARFTTPDRTSVELTTLSQSELPYVVNTVNLKDLSGTAMAPRVVGPGGVIIDPSSARFSGSPPSEEELIDSDGDGITDDAEQRGWEVQIKLANGTVITRDATSNPLKADSDADGLNDADEAALRTDPRDKDTDDDHISDAEEFNEIYSNPAEQDTDGDGIDDYLEFAFFKTSPNQADTDGDRLLDGEETLLGNRNPRVADLPAPTLSVGETRVRLDVRFTESTSTESRELETRSVTSTLTQSDSKEFSNTTGSEYGFGASVSQEKGTEITAGVEAGALYSQPSVSVTQTSTFGTEVNTSGTWTSEHTDTSTRATERAYEQSLSTDEEVTEGASVERTVQGATMQATVYLRNASNLGYRLKNLQLTAFIQDPQDPTKLSPVATLTPDAEPEDGYTLGPLGVDRGPLIFTNTTIFPALAESLMKNPRGVVYKFSNYDIIDEFGRNFAFTAREIIDRTAGLTIDFGGFDSNGDGEGDFSEYKRIATSGGRVIDTNGDGVVGAGDRRVLFGPDGKEVGVTLREALAANGLAHHYEKIDAANEARLLGMGIPANQIKDSDALTDDQLKNSYSTFFTGAGVAGVLERIFRVRETARTPGSAQNWEVVTKTGIDRTVGLDELVLTSDSGARLAFVQDLDLDGLPANLEFLNKTSDNLRDTDGDNLDDRFELLIGWDATVTPFGTKRVFSRPANPDTDQDGLRDDVEAPTTPFDRNGDGLPDRYDPVPGEIVTDPSAEDTDGDGVPDKTEIDGYTVNLRGGGSVFVRTDPTNFDTDGDTASDGLEFKLGGDPTVADLANFGDADEDGLVNIVETDGWDIVVRATSGDGFVEGAGTTVRVTSDPFRADTDGDGLKDGYEFRFFQNRGNTPDGDEEVRTNPRSTDTDGDGLSDKLEALGFELRDLGVILLNPADADTDNDRLKDGEEAELSNAETGQYIVRVVGKENYRVFTNPLLADQDFDGLVDGEEKYKQDGAGNLTAFLGADPTKANTDGDRRDDAEEIAAGLNPLQEDFKVTVVFDALHIQGNGDDGGAGAGDFGFDFGVRLPSNTSPSGLSSTFTPAVREQVALTGTLSHGSGYSSVRQYLPDAGDDYDSDETLVDVSRFGVFGIPIGDDQTLNFAGLVPDNQRSVTFSMTKQQRFSIEGVVVEVDSPSSNRTAVYLGGLSGVKGTKPEDETTVRTVFSGVDLYAQTDAFTEMEFRFKDEDNIRTNNNDPISGTVKFYYIVD